MLKSNCYSFVPAFIDDGEIRELCDFYFPISDLEDEDIQFKPLHKKPEYFLVWETASEIPA